MKRRTISILIVICLFAVGCIFINSVSSDWQEGLGSVYQVKGHKIMHNDKNIAKIKLDVSKKSFNNIRYSYSILTENDPIYVGERKEIVNDLGKYRVEIILNDTAFQTKAVKNIGFRKTILLAENNPDGFVKTMRVAYPPSDSEVAVYFGFNDEPTVDIKENMFNIMIEFKSKKQDKQ